MGDFVGTPYTQPYDMVRIGESGTKTGPINASTYADRVVILVSVYLEMGIFGLE